MISSHTKSTKVSIIARSLASPSLSKYLCSTPILTTLLAIPLCLSTLACTEQPAGTAAVPEYQFSLQNINVEQMHEGQKAWTLRASRADGTTDDVMVDEVKIRFDDPQSPGQTQSTIVAPSGQFSTTTSVFELEDAVLRQSDGPVVMAEKARYEPQQRAIKMEGSVKLDSKRLQLMGTRGTYYLDEDAVEIDGPITGKIFLR